MKRILLVEDDENFSIVLKSYLEIHEYEVTHAKDGLEGLKLFNRKSFDICILDIMMPKMDGFMLAQKISDINPNFPFLFLTAKSLKQDILKGYQLGALDYLNKPFDSEILLQKLDVILKRTTTDATKTNEPVLRFAHFILDVTHRTLTHKTQIWKLSPKETELLSILVRKKNEVVSRDFILRQIWNEADYFKARSMDVYVNKLRKYLKNTTKVNLENIHGKGFVLKIN